MGTKNSRRTRNRKMGERKQNGVENIVEGRERKTVQRDTLRDKFELLLGLLSATARIQHSVNYVPKYFIIKHFAVLIVAPTTAGNEKKKEKRANNALEAT